MLKRFLGNSAIFVLATLANQGLMFLLLPLYARYLSPADYGILTFCSTTAILLSTFMSLCLNSAVTLFYFKLEGPDYRRMFGTVWLWLALVPLGLIGVLEVLGPAIALRAFPSIPWDPYIRLALWIAYFTIAPALYQALLMAEQRPLAHSALVIVSFLLTTSLVIAFVVFRGQGALGSLRGQVIGGAIVATALHATVLRKSSLTMDWGYLGSAMRLCLPLLPHSLCMWALNVSDRWILVRFVPTTDLGLYSMAYTLGTAVLLSGIALGNAFTPIYYKGVTDPEVRTHLPRAVSASLLISTWITLAVSVLTPEVLRIMTRPAYYGAADLVPWIAAGHWFLVGFYYLSLGVIQYHQRTKWLLLITCPAAALNVGLNWFLIPRYGTMAAAVDTLVAFGLVGVLSLVLAERIDRLPYSWHAIGLMLLVALAAFGAGFYGPSPDRLILSVSFKCLILLAAGTLMAYLSGFAPRELWDAGMRVLGRIPGFRGGPAPGGEADAVGRVGCTVE